MVKKFNKRIILTGTPKPYLEINKSLQLFYNDIRSYKPLKQEEIEKLFTLYRNGTKEERQSAFAKICKHNERLVVSMAREYCSATDSLNDLIQEGNIGLMKAVEQYDFSSGASFGGYALYWIRRYISLFKNNTTPMIYQPVYSTFKNSIKEVSNKLNHELERSPTSEEILDELKKNKPKQRFNHKDDLVRVEYLYIDSADDNTEDQANTKQKYDQIQFSSEVMAHNDYLDIIEGESTKNMVSNLMSILTKNEATVVSMFYGLNGNDESSMKTIAEGLNFTPQRISQIYASAITKMKNAAVKQSYKYK